VRTLHGFLGGSVGHRWQIVIAENGSTDGTRAVARRVAAELPRVSVLELDVAGRGRALRAAWTRSTADIVAYTDVDLSSRLEAFPRLLDAIVKDGCHVAVGSRLAPGARTTRSVRREVISRGYNLLLRLALGVHFSDAQTGFKALACEAVDAILPLATDQGWFLDTELLVLAERLGYRIADIPVEWVENPDSRVRILSTAWADVKGVGRLRRTLRGIEASRAGAGGRGDPLRQ
jgi:glycosyltransferase involved in cell wall biosynthesis